MIYVLYNTLWDYINKATILCYVSLLWDLPCMCSTTVPSLVPYSQEWADGGVVVFTLPNLELSAYTARCLHGFQVPIQIRRHSHVPTWVQTSYADM